MVIELKRKDISLLINLLTQQIDSVNEAKERHALYGLSRFYRLVDMRNKLLAVPVTEKLTVAFSDKQREKFSTDKKIKYTRINRKIKQPERGAR